jgi:heme exporter protein B
MEIVLNMSLFAVLMLTIAQLGTGGDTLVVSRVGPVFFWMAVVFTGTVGISQSFAAEREGGLLNGIQLAPIDHGIFYLAKVAATWIYVMAMGLALLGVYILFFNFMRVDLYPALISVMAVFALGYTGVGIILSSMTTALRGGGEIVLRILLLPLMVPVVMLTLMVSEATFGVVVANGILGPPLELWKYLLTILSLDAIYLVIGYLVFPKIIEE